MTVGPDEISVTFEQWYDAQLELPQHEGPHGVGYGQNWWPSCTCHDCWLEHSTYATERA